MKINGVNYKFKPGVHPNVNKRFVGYIAQQVESVVPEAVQLIDGILHVDYESLIPYLSESIRQNFNDIKTIKSDNAKIRQALDTMYDAFINKNNSSTITPGVQNVKKMSSSSTPLGLKIIFVSLAVAFAIAGAFGLFYWQRTTTPHQLNATPVSPLTPDKPTQPLQVIVPTSPQRYALQALYHATNGPHWTNRKNWLTDNSICTWYGVTCSNLNEDVVVLVLDNNRLNGTIPEAIGLLSQLRGANLAYNELCGTIPESIYNLTHVVHLQLMFNGLVGTLSSRVSDFSNLYELDLSGNKLSGPLPTTLGELTHATKLSMNNNQFTGYVPTFLPGELEKLDLSQNNLFGTVPELTSLGNLNYLNLGHNQLEGTIPNLPSGLHLINLSHNQLSGTIDAFNSLNPTAKNPLRVDVSYNQLTGEISPLTQFAAIAYLDVSANLFSAFSTMAVNITQADLCNAENNNFKCPLPDGADTFCHATCT